MKDTWMEKGLVISVILLFIVVAVAPTINYSIVKASTDNDFVEVTSQACGIQGYGNTTIRLTKQQYQDLEQYLVEFRARLNQTTTRDEAVPIFKEAVVELNKYGLLPKGMSVERAQKLVMGKNNNLCLIAGSASNVESYGFPISYYIDFDAIIIRLINFLPLAFLVHLHSTLQNKINYFLSSSWLLFAFYALIPLKLFSCLSFGIKHNGLGGPLYPSEGWIYTIGFTGINSWNNSFIGNISSLRVVITPLADNTYFIGVTSFTGIYMLNINTLNVFFIGTAGHVALATNS